MRTNFDRRFLFHRDPAGGGFSNFFDPKKIKSDALDAVKVWQGNLNRIYATAGEKEKLVIAQAQESAAFVRGELEADRWEKTLAVEALTRVERTLSNELEAIQDELIKQARKVTVQSAIMGGISMVLGVLGSAKLR